MAEAAAEAARQEESEVARSEDPTRREEAVRSSHRVAEGRRERKGAVRAAARQVQGPRPGC